MQIPIVSSTSLPNVLVVNRTEFAVTELEALSSYAHPIFIDQAGRDEFIPKLNELVKSTPGGFKACVFFMRWNEPAPFPLDEGLADVLIKKGGCKLFVAGGAGYDKVDVDYLTGVGCLYANNPVTMGIRTADSTAMMILSILRGSSIQEKNARNGKWRDNDIVVKDARTCTLGIIGMGRIGKYVANHMQSFGMKVIYTKRTRLPVEEEDGCEYRTLDQLLAESDVVSLNCPLNAETRHLIAAPEFAKMKDGVLIVNTARGAVIKEDDLVNALNSGKVLRAALDVFEFEPEIHPGLIASPNTFLLPHCAALNETMRFTVEKEILENLRVFLKTGLPNTPVNVV
ncbi:D-isomer specific 2-hydroxyacid dehydrogenase [Mrakia frigida]|uniref:D-mandelate dehydrogenase-like dehydrogenase n=1 Tax=Mrakia frigida TaxID=29902 RepID=UPI003FCC0080